MHKLLRKLSLYFLLCFCSILYADPTTQFIHYHDSGQYRKEVQTVITRADNYMLERVHHNQHRRHPEKLAIVLDIDETSLSNYRHMQAERFTHDLNRIRQYILAADAPAIHATKALYKKALARGVHVFFVTGRRETKECTAARKNLLRAGYAKWDGLYCRPDSDHAHTARLYKAHQRQAIMKKGYTIIATIGDQDSDIRGGYAEKGFKLPNPFYLIA